MEIKIYGTVEEIAALVSQLQERRKEDALFLAVRGNASGEHVSQDGIEIQKC